MYLSSTAISRRKISPWPLSQVSVTGCAGVSVRALAVQTASAVGVGTAPPAGTQPNSA
jgi:hypothetical protein